AGPSSWVPSLLGSRSQDVPTTDALTVSNDKGGARREGKEVPMGFGQKLTGEEAARSAQGFQK
ncbi:MAG: hypothetical protein ACREKH_03950, partial [Candidatus Rokuibacteriota bacterium]